MQIHNATVEMIRVVSDFVWAHSSAEKQKFVCRNGFCENEAMERARSPTDEETNSGDCTYSFIVVVGIAVKFNESCLLYITEYIPAHSVARILIHHCSHDGMIADKHLVNIIMDVGRLIAITRLSDQFNLTFS